jgi:hypothetical protein
MLSSNAQKLISFFTHFGGAESTANPMANLAEIFQQLPDKQKNSLTDLAPAVLSMLSSQNSKGNGAGGLNPALISTLLSTFMNNNKKED